MALHINIEDLLNGKAVENNRLDYKEGWNPDSIYRTIRRYRNRRLGEFLKELDLTEGRSTGIPTIQEELANNGSPAATIETDDARTYFIIDIPCHKDFVSDVLVLNEEADVLKNVLKKCCKQIA